MATNTSYALSYSKSGKSFVDINGKTYGPYNTAYGLVSGNSWGFSYANGLAFGDENININGKVYGPYFSANYFSLSNNNWLMSMATSLTGLIM